MDASRKWTDARGGLIHYHIEGRLPGAGQRRGGQQLDRLRGCHGSRGHRAGLGPRPIEAGRHSPDPERQIHRSNPRNPEPKCLPPILRGEYEHYDLLGIKNGLGGALEFQVRTVYPTVEVAQMCTGSRVKVPASVKTRSESFVVISPVLLDSQVPDSDSLRISKDRKSMIHKQGGWTWTYTPSVKQ